MKKLLFIVPTVIALAACTGNNTPAEGSGQDSLTEEQQKDSTIYGRSTEFGMSSFSLITDAGDTIDLNRGEGTLWGNLDNEGDRFALTIQGAGTDDASVDVAINLTDVEKFTKDFSVYNGRLILSGDTVSLIDLTADSLIAKGAKGEYRLKAK